MDHEKELHMTPAPETALEPPAAASEGTASPSAQDAPPAEDDVPAPETASEAPARADTPTDILYARLSYDLTQEQTAIVTALTDALTPIRAALTEMQGEITDSRRIGMENVTYKAQTEALTRQVSELRAELKAVDSALASAQAENESLRSTVTSLTQRNEDLDQKLQEAYAINSREASLEAERIRADLERDVSFLYEDWLEYEFADVSEENFESIQAIIKSIFRALERNRIHLEGKGL